MKKTLAVALLVLLLGTPIFAGGQGEDGADGDEPIVLVGATQLPAKYVFYRTLVKFSELVDEYYDGQIEWVLTHSGELGSEKDFVEYMIQGISVDFAVVAPSWMATWDQRVSFMDPPFLWESVDHWNRGLASGVFDPIADDLLDKGIRILGYGGGGTRNLILNQPVEEMEDLPPVLLRVMGSPIQARAFNATGIQATPMDYLEVYNAIKTGVVDGLENESASLKAMKFYEVAPYVVQTRHAITVRPLLFSESRFQSLPEDLQEAILRAGEEAAAWHRETEVREDAEALQAMAEDGMIEIVQFEERDQMRAEALPVLEDYAEELGALDIWNNVQALE